MSRKLFATLVYRELDRLGITITEYAALLGVSPVAVRKALNKDSVAIVQRGTLYKYARGLGLSTDYFLAKAGLI